MKISYFRHATAEKVPVLERQGFELISFVYWRGGQACFLMREKPKYEHQAKSGEPKE